MIVTPYLVLCLVLYACFTDVRHLKIPNFISIAILVLFLGTVAWEFFNAGAPLSLWIDNILAALAMFVITFVFFAFKIFGAGDAKLATVISLWTGVHGMIAFLFFMTFTGGVLGVIALVFMKKGVPKSWQKGWLKKLAEGRPDIPYAIAIFVGTFASFISLGYV